MGKYYKFRTGPPSNWEQLCVIFDGTTATGKLRYASTQSPPPSTCSDRHVDLNILPAIVDLTEPHPFPQRVSRDKGKAKRHASPIDSSRSSKRSSSAPEVFQMVTDKLNFLQNSYEKKCNINESGHSRTTAPMQEAPLPKHLRNLSWIELITSYHPRCNCLWIRIFGRVRQSKMKVRQG